MTSAASIARPYANAAFLSAKESHQLPLWSQVLKNCSLAVQDSQMSTLLKNPAVTKKQLADLLIDFFHKVSGNGSTNGYLLIDNFIRVLAEKKRLVLLPNISDLFEEDLAKESGYLSLTVTSAYAMDDQQKKSVKEKLTKQLNSALVIQFQVDETVVGGLLVRSGNWVLDGTIKGQLERLKSALI